MRLAMVALLACGCVKSTVADPGTAVTTAHTAPAGALVVMSCPEALAGDDGGYSPLYLVDAAGAVTRWVPDPLPEGAENLSSASTPALYFDAMLKLWSLTPDGKVHLLDESPSRDESRFSSDGAHRLVVSEKNLEWRTLDGGVEHRFELSEFPSHVYPSPNGERAVAKLKDTTALIDAHGPATLLDHQLLIGASWSPGGKEVALVTQPLAGGATPVDDRALLWRAKLDGSAPVPLALPARPGPGLIDRVLGVPQTATAVRGLVWTDEGLAILSNHESECWWGGRDNPSGCYWALYRLPPEGGTPKRLSPRAFRCQALFQLR
ncbi:MAG: hypothetical protein QM723_18630 [Myxococcaceae bacterium]